MPSSESITAANRVACPAADRQGEPLIHAEAMQRQATVPALLPGSFAKNVRRTFS